MHLIDKSHTEHFNYYGPYPAKQKTKDGYIWYMNRGNTYFLTHDGLTRNIADFYYREGGWKREPISVQDLSEAKFPEGFIGKNIPPDCAKGTHTQEWNILDYLNHESSTELIVDLIITAQKMIKNQDKETSNI
jgi:hypothetical protein